MGLEVCIDPIERYPWISFPVEVTCNPVLSTFPSGKRFAIAGSKWIEVPLDSTRADLPKWMKYNPPRPSYDEVKVEGSKGSIYTVRKETTTGEVTCTCPEKKLYANHSARECFERAFISLTGQSSR